MACPGGVFGAALSAGARLLGWLGFPLSVWTPSSCLQQQPPVDPAGASLSQSRVTFLGLCARRIVGDWPARFGHPLLLLETFVDPARFQGTVYRAANWQAVGHSRGFRRGGAGYCELSTPKRVFLYPLARNVGQQLSGAALDPTLRKGAPKIMLSADHIRSLPDVFRDIDDPRTARGGAIPCTAPSPSRPPRRCAAHAATRRFGNGSMILARKRLPASRSGAATVSASRRANPPSAPS